MSSLPPSHRQKTFLSPSPKHTHTQTPPPQLNLTCNNKGGVCARVCVCVLCLYVWESDPPPAEHLRASFTRVSWCIVGDDCEHVGTCGTPAVSQSESSRGEGGGSSQLNDTRRKTNACERDFDAVCSQNCDAVMRSGPYVCGSGIGHQSVFIAPCKML